MNVITHRKPRGQGASRRAEILEAAQRLFLELGYEQATMRRIAAQIGVSAAALYVYFPDKAAILRAIAETTFDALLARLRDATTAEANPLDCFRAGLRAYIAFGLERPDAYRLIFVAPAETKPCADDIPAAGYSFAILEESIAALMANGAFAPGFPFAAAETVWALLHGVTVLLLDQAPHLQTPPGTLIDHAIQLAERGLRAN